MFVIVAGLAVGCTGQIEDPSVGTVGAPPAPGSTVADGGAAGGLAPDLDPGRVTLHRLNRVEYANTVRDLLGTTLRPADDFPADDRGYGYDNIADVLSLSPVQIEMYFNAAEALIDEAHERRAGRRAPLRGRGDDRRPPAPSPGTRLQPQLGRQRAAERSRSPPRGEYRIAVRAWAQQAGPDPAQHDASTSTPRAGDRRRDRASSRRP